MLKKFIYLELVVIVLVYLGAAIYAGSFNISYIPQQDRGGIFGAFFTISILMNMLFAMNDYYDDEY